MSLVERCMSFAKKTHVSKKTHIVLATKGPFKGPFAKESSPFLTDLDSTFESESVNMTQNLSFSLVMKRLFCARVLTVSHYSLDQKSPFDNKVCLCVALCRQRSHSEVSFGERATHSTVCGFFQKEQETERETERETESVTETCSA